MYRRALVGFEKALGAEHPSTLKSVNTLGSLLKATGRRSDAIALLCANAEISEKIRDGVRYNLASYECLEGNIEEAKQLISAHLQAHPEMKPRALADSDFTAIRIWMIENCH